MCAAPLARLGFTASTASRSFWRTSTTLNAPTSSASPCCPSSFCFFYPSLPFSSTIPPSTLSRVALVSRHFSSTPSTMSYAVRKIGQPYTLEHRVYVEQNGVPVSPFHDIPLFANEQKTILNMIVEIPRWTNAKQEV